MAPLKRSTKQGSASPHVMPEGHLSFGELSPSAMSVCCMAMFVPHIAGPHLVNSVRTKVLFVIVWRGFASLVRRTSSPH